MHPGVRIPVGHRLRAAVFSLFLSFVSAAYAAEPDYRAAMAQGALLEALPLAEAALAKAQHGSRLWRDIASDVVQLQTDTARYAAAEATLSTLQSDLARNPDRALAATIAYRRGLLRLEQERYEESGAAHAEALKIRSALHGTNHPAVAEILADLGQTLSFLGRFDDAERAMRRALDIQSRILGPDAVKTSLTLTYLASHEEARGNAARARDLALRALRIQETQPNHPRTANTLFTLARAKAALGDRDGAIADLKRTLAIDRAGRGPTHPYLAIAQDELAALYDEVGAHQEARASREASFGINRSHLGPDHAYTLDSQAALAKAHRTVGAYAQAAALLRDLVPRLRASRGEASDDLLVALDGLGGALSLAADPTGAEAAYRQLLRLVEQRFGTEHGETATVLNNLGHILVSQGRYGDAEPILKRAIGMIERTLGRDHHMAGIALGNLGHVYLEQGLIEQARPLLQRSLEIMERIHGGDSLEVAKNLNNLALAELLGGWYEDSIESFGRAIAIIEAKLGTRHPQLTNPLNNLALERLGRGAEGRAPLTRAIAIAEASLGEDHTSTAALRHGMAKLLGGLGAFDEAQQHLDRTAKTFSSRLSPDHPKLADLLLTNAIFDMERDRRAAALDRLRQARAILEKRAALALASPALDATAELRKAEKTFLFHLTVLDRAETVSPADLAEAFEVAQLTQLGAAATALTRMAARFAAGDDGLAQRVRARQDAANQWTRADAALTEALGLPQIERDVGAEKAWHAQRDAAAARMRTLDDELASTFPRYQQMVGVRPMTLAAARNLLGPDEVLMTFLTIEEATAMIAVRGNETVLHLVEGGAADLAASVDRLRRGLDPTRISDESELHRFDTKSAHDLYKKLFAPAEHLLKGANHLFVVLDGALTSLPVGVLLTEPREADRHEFADYRTMPWLARRFPISVLPSVSALRSLRQLAGRPASRKICSASVIRCWTTIPAREQHRSPRQVPSR